MPHDSHSHDRSGLTRNQSLVLDALLRARAPLTAYDLLDKLRGDGLRAPLQIYRALDKLVALGHAHKLESLSAYMACQHPEERDHQATIFMICSKCGAVKEQTDSKLGGGLNALAEAHAFSVDSSTIELRGHCRKC